MHLNKQRIKQLIDGSDKSLAQNSSDKSLTQNIMPEERMVLNFGFMFALSKMMKICSQSDFQRKFKDKNPFSRPNSNQMPL